jgi:hypothetical protein
MQREDHADHLSSASLLPRTPATSLKPKQSSFSTCLASSEPQFVGAETEKSKYVFQRPAYSCACLHMCGDVFMGVCIYVCACVFAYVICMRRCA